MKIALLSLKGGVGKTTGAIHLAYYLNSKAPTLLCDGDENRSALSWSERGQLPFKVVSEKAAPKYWNDFEHIVIDTGARPSRADLKDLADICDQFIIVTGCDALSLDVLLPMAETLREVVGNERFKVLLNEVPPVGRAGDDARQAVKEIGIPLFKGQVRRYAAFGKAALVGTTVDQVRDDHAADGWQDFQAIGKELTR